MIGNMQLPPISPVLIGDNYDKRPPKDLPEQDLTGHAGLAQLVEHLICNQEVGGSSPSAGTKTLIINNRLRSISVFGKLCPFWCPHNVRNCTAMNPD